MCEGGGWDLRHGSSGGGRSSSGTICGRIDRLPCCGGLSCCICGLGFVGGVAASSAISLKLVVGEAVLEGRPLHWC